MEQMIHQGCIQLIFHLQQTGLFVGVTSGPGVIGLGNNAVQHPEGIGFHREGGHQVTVVHGVNGVNVVNGALRESEAPDSKALGLAKCPGRRSLLLFPGH